MKKSIQIIVIAILTTTLYSCSSYKRIGALTMVSTRNIDSKTDYKLIEKNIEGKAKMKNNDALQQAIEEAVKKLQDGEYMKNVTVYVKGNGKYIKVVGDVWGLPSVQKNITTEITEKIELKIGDKVAFKNKSGKLTDGKIIGINSDSAIVELENLFGKIIKSEVKFSELTKLQ